MVDRGVGVADAHRGPREGVVERPTARAAGEDGVRGDVSYG